MERHISSLVVHGRPDALATLTAAIGSIPGAEVPIADPRGKMVVTLETATDTEVADALTRISLMDGVLAATLVYHQVDEDA